MKPRTVLVTGGAGYIGAHACKALAAAGDTPVVYDNLSTGHREAVRWGPFEEGDIADGVRLDEVFQRYRPSAVIHFAAFAYVGESTANPLKYYRNNVAGSLTLIERMLANGVTSIVFSSTCATYGVPGVVPIADDAPQAPINPYGRSKLMVEAILRDACDAHGLSAVALRYFNAAGASPDGDIGERHEPETHLIPLVLEAACDKSKPIMIFGTDYETPDGTCVRDYIHVDDLASAHVAAVGALADGLSGFVGLNLGTGTGHSVRTIISETQRLTNLSVAHEEAPRRAGDPPILIAEAGKAAALLGWRPEHSDLETILRTAWAWRNRA